MTLINLEDVLAIVTELQGSNINKFRMSVQSLPTHDPIAVLKDMIDEHKTLRKNSESERDMIKFDAKLSILIEARNRINQ